MLEITGEQNANDAPELADVDRLFGRAIAQLKCGIVLTAEDAASLQARGPLPPAVDDKRGYVRFACSARAILDCRPTLPSIPRPRQRFLVLVKNVSRSGVCFLHEGQLFPRERCQLWIERRRPLSVEIARCRRLREGCYEVGARFK